MPDSNRHQNSPQVTRPHNLYRTVLAYFLVGTSWIVVTDSLLAFRSVAQFQWQQTLKGITYVAFTAAVLSLLLERWEKAWKRATAEREQLAAALASKQRLLSFSLLHSRLGAWELNPKSGLLRWSEETEVVFHERLEETLEGLLGRMNAPDQKGLLEALDQATSDGQPFSLECTLRVGQGSRWVEIQGQAQQLRQEPWVIGTLHDIQARKESEFQHEQTRSQLLQTQKLESIALLAGGIAHDFNNLLTVILGQAELILVDQTEAAEAAEAVREAGERAAGLTRQLLLFARKQKAEKIPLRLSQSVEQTARLLRRTLGEHIELKVTCDGEDAPILADPSMIEQILLNLAVNARDAMPGGGVLEISTRAREQIVTLEVRDTGSGIPTELLPRIWEPFFSTKAAGKGSGLGLATVHGIAQEHGARLEVESALGLGTTFLLEFPVCSATELQIAPTRISPEEIRGNESILLVEDQVLVREFLRVTLQGLGYEVTAVSSTAEALQAFESGTYAVLISDVVLGSGMNGAELAACIRGKQPDQPVLLISGYQQEAAMPADIPLLEKPFRPQDLAGRIRALCREQAGEA